MTVDDNGQNPILQLVYASSETSPFSDEDLLALLEQSRAANEARQVTGMLLYHKGSFIQALEGDPEVVTALYEKITRDGRHHNERLVFETTVAERSFTGWSMSFHRVDDTSELPPEVVDFLATGSIELSEADEGLIRQVFLGFRDGAYHRGREGVTDQRVAPVNER